MHAAQPEKGILMSGTSTQRSLVIAVMLGGLVLASSAPAEAQRAYEPLFDKFSFKGELSWVGLSTSVGLYDEESGQGCSPQFRGRPQARQPAFHPVPRFRMAGRQTPPSGGTVAESQPKSNTQALTEIEWGDETIPIDADISLESRNHSVFRRLHLLSVGQGTLGGGLRARVPVDRPEDPRSAGPSTPARSRRAAKGPT